MKGQIRRLRNQLPLIPQRPRWEEYRHIIRYALGKGYVITSLIRWFEGVDGGEDQKTLIMRHDVDHHRKGAERMHRIERELGVHSTFYFRWSTLDLDLMRRIEESGSEVGLHYETIATYALKHGIFKREGITGRVVKECQSLLKDEIRRFGKYANIRSISSHGAWWNRHLGIPNKILIENESPSEYGVKMFAYDTQVLERFDKYISDGQASEQYWRYGTTPIEALNEGLTTICCLTHPNWWDHYWRVSYLKYLAAPLMNRIRGIYDELR